MNALVARLALLFLIPAIAFADDGLYRTQAKIDWVARTVEFDASLDLKLAGIKMPSGRSQAELLVSRDLAEITRDAFLSMTVDSRETTGTALTDGVILPEEIQAILETAKPVAKRFSDDMKFFSVRFTFGFGAFERLFVHHSGAYFQAKSLEYRPTRPYTGIVIVAKEKLPVHGEHTTAFVSPCFFPRIYDSAMNLILEKNMASPTAIEKWGLLGYSTETDSISLENRVGSSPLRILAEGLFGTNRTDVIINTEDALKIISSEENRKLLAEGKVILVLDNTVTILGE